MIDQATTLVVKVGSSLVTNEGRYFTNKFDHQFTVAQADVFQRIGGVNSQHGDQLAIQTHIKAIRCNAFMHKVMHLHMVKRQA